MKPGAGLYSIRASVFERVLPLLLSLALVAHLASSSPSAEPAVSTGLGVTGARLIALVACLAFSLLTWSPSILAPGSTQGSRLAWGVAIAAFFVAACFDDLQGGLWLMPAIAMLFLGPDAKQARTLALLLTGIWIVTTFIRASVAIESVLPSSLPLLLGAIALGLAFRAHQGRATETRAQAHQLEKLIAAFDELRAHDRGTASRNLLEAFCALAALRDNETGNHILRTRLYVRSLATSLVLAGQETDQLNPERIELIADAAPMHDLGKIGIPDAILLKPGRHTPDESAVMRTHAIIGENVLQTAARAEATQETLLGIAARIAGGHHEHWDGSGYPRGLIGREIPLEARLMAVADVYDALTTQRPYKTAWSHDSAAAEIRRLSGSKFDPMVVEAFNRCERQFLEIAERLREPSQEG
jgi:response regulator RpfG family c-di-GMP phosphodiesterase